MKNLLIVTVSASLALCLLLCWAFDHLQAEGKADVARQEAAATL